MLASLRVWGLGPGSYYALSEVGGLYVYVFVYLYACVLCTRMYVCMHTSKSLALAASAGVVTRVCFAHILVR